MVAVMRQRRGQQLGDASGVGGRRSGQGGGSFDGVG
jgi:hypothetical protein